MRNKLPVYIENNEMPVDQNSVRKKNSYGYVSFLYLGSLIITIISLLSVLFMWYR